MNNLLILVVEDDVPVRNLIGTTLKTHGYNYMTASTGESALMQASSNNPNIVLLDLGLPDIDGVDVIKKIRTWSELPIIVISARTEDKEKIEDIYDRAVKAIENYIKEGNFNKTASLFNVKVNK